MSMKFTPSHEWILLEKEIGTVGITKQAQDELGEVVYIELPQVGKRVLAGQEVAVLESTKAAADIYSPVTGEITEINKQLTELCDKINSSPEGDGWLFKIKVENQAELDPLLSRTDYLNLLKS